jgi:ATP-binding cassette, subfamily B, bacterial PglK
MLAALKKCLVFLTPRERWQWVGLVPLTIAVAVMEALGAAMVLWFIKIINAPSHIAELPMVRAMYRVFPWRDGQENLLCFTVLIALFYLLKNSVSAVGIYVQSRIVSKSMATVSARMLGGYLMLPYALHLRRNSADLIHNLTNAVEVVFSVVLTSAVSIASEILVVMGIITVLIAATPLAALAACVILGGLSAALLKLTRRTFIRCGVQSQALGKSMLQNLQQAFGGLKEIKVLGRERFFHEVFSSQQGALFRIQCRRATLDAVPRLLVESTFVCGTLLVVILLTLQGHLGADVLPLLGLYAYAGFRIIPSANRMLWRINEIRYGTPAVHQLYDDYTVIMRNASDACDASAGASTPFSDRIVVEGLSYTYAGSHTPALQDVHLTIRRGESIGIVGPTGAGKSTLVDILIGLLEPSGGRITVDSIVLHKQIRSWQRQIGCVPQTIFLADDSLRRNIALGIPDDDIDNDKVQAAVRMAQLEAFVASLPDGLNTSVGERGVRLSGGERQRVGIARALYYEPEVLVFDEATSALDSRTESEVARAIEALHGEKTLIIVAHRLSTVRHCDRLLLLKKGHAADCGSFEELLARNADFRAMAVLTELDIPSPED